jgi:hypothetical protein
MDKSTEPAINKGIELMLRREQPETPKKNGVVLDHSFTLLGNTIQFKFEFTWGQSRK